MNNIAVIRDAMSRKLDGQPHKPEKISFKYLKHNINDVKQEVERRKGDTYIVNPFALMINDGNYYLLAFDDKKKKEWHYRVDRMKDVQLTGIERECEDEFKKIDLHRFIKHYTKHTFVNFVPTKKSSNLYDYCFSNKTCSSSFKIRAKPVQKSFKSIQNPFETS